MTPKRERFIKEYLIDLNATQAAIRAGYSPKTAGQIGEEILKKPEIRAAVKQEMDKRAARIEITADRVLRELASIGFADTTQAVKIKGGNVRVTDTDKLPEDTRRAIAEIRQTVTKEGGSLGIKFHDKKGALELLGKHLGIWTEGDGDGDAPQVVKVHVEVVDGRKP